MWWRPISGDLHCWSLCYSVCCCCSPRYTLRFVWYQLLITLPFGAFLCYTVVDSLNCCSTGFVFYSCSMIFLVHSVVGICDSLRCSAEFPHLFICCCWLFTTLLLLFCCYLRLFFIRYLILFGDSYTRWTYSVVVAFCSFSWLRLFLVVTPTLMDWTFHISLVVWLLLFLLFIVVRCCSSSL